MGTVPMINPINGLIESRGVPVNAELARIAEK